MELAQGVEIGREVDDPCPQATRVAPRERSESFQADDVARVERGARLALDRRLPEAVAGTLELRLQVAGFSARTSA